MNICTNNNQYTRTMSAEKSSFISKAYTRDEFLSAIDSTIQKNLKENGHTLEEIMEMTCEEGRNATFKFAGESKLYSFNEYIAELNKRCNTENTSEQANRSVRFFSDFSLDQEGELVLQEDEEHQGFIAEFIDYEKFHKAWMSQGANTPFSYTENKGFNKEENSISLVPGMSVRLNNGFMISIKENMVQAMGDFMDNAAAKESTAVAGALNHLIKVANGQIPMNMFYSRNQDNSAYAKIGLQAFGIDTSRPFTINEKTFHFDNDGQIRLGSGSDNNAGGTEEIDFSKFAPNAPDEVKQAFTEAANETGYDETGKMNHISQILVKRVENTFNGVPNPNDIFGSTVESALQAAKELLYDLEHPLVPINEIDKNVEKYIEQEKEFYRAFIEKLEKM